MSWATAENMARQDMQRDAFRALSAWRQYDREFQEYLSKKNEYDAYELLEKYQVKECKKFIKKLVDNYEYISRELCDLGVKLAMPATLGEFNDFSPERRREYVVELIRIGDKASGVEGWHCRMASLLGRIQEWSDYQEYVPGSISRALRLVADYADFCRGEGRKTTIEDVLRALKITDKNDDLDKTGKEMLYWHEHGEREYRELSRRIYALAYYLEDIDRPEKPIAPEEPRWPRPDGEFSSCRYW